MTQIAEALKHAGQQLVASDTARVDAEILLCHCLACDRSHVYAHPEQELPQWIDEIFFQMVEKRAVGHPIAHLIASREFWSMRLQVTPDTLIPRPETECLVETALKLIPKGAYSSILDLGTGSGAIAIAMAAERPRAQLIATDINAAALDVAQRNAAAHKIGNIHFIHADWFGFEINKPFDMIISNPPYISPSDSHLQQGDVRFEQKTALVAEDNGMAAIRTIVKGAYAYMKSNGWLILEHGCLQGDIVRSLLRQQGLIKVRTGLDYAELNRFTVGQRMA